MSCAVTLVRALIPQGSQQPVVWTKKMDLPMTPFPGLTLQTPLPPFVPGADNPDGREGLPVQGIVFDTVKNEVVCVLPPTELPAAQIPAMESHLRAQGWEQHLPSRIVQPPPGLHLM